MKLIILPKLQNQLMTVLVLESLIVIFQVFIFLSKLCHFFTHAENICFYCSYYALKLIPKPSQDSCFSQKSLMAFRSISFSPGEFPATHLLPVRFLTLLFDMSMATQMLEDYSFFFNLYFLNFIYLFLFSYNCLHFLPFPPPHPKITAFKSPVKLWKESVVLEMA